MEETIELALEKEECVEEQKTKKVLKRQITPDKNEVDPERCVTPKKTRHEGLSMFLKSFLLLYNNSSLRCCWFLFLYLTKVRFVARRFCRSRSSPSVKRKLWPSCRLRARVCTSGCAETVARASRRRKDFRAIASCQSKFDEHMCQFKRVPGRPASNGLDTEQLGVKVIEVGDGSVQGAL